MRLNIGIRGTIPSVAYSPFEIGWALSVQVASTRPSSGSGSRRSSSARPSPRACSPGSTKSIDRNHSGPRSTADPNATTWLPPARSRQLGDEEARRVRRERVGVQPAHARVVLRQRREAERARVVVDPVPPDAMAVGQVRLGRPARSTTPGGQPPVAAGRQPLELGLHERVEVAVEHGGRVRRLDLGAQVLDHLVGVEHVAPDLVAPARLDVLAAQLAQLGLLLLELALEEPRLQDLDRGLLVLGLAALVLALGDDARREVRQAHRRVGLVDVLAARTLRAVRVDADLVPVELDRDVLVRLGHDLDQRRTSSGVGSGRRTG